MKSKLTFDDFDTYLSEFETNYKAGKIPRSIELLDRVLAETKLTWLQQKQVNQLKRELEIWCVKQGIKYE